MQIRIRSTWAVMTEQTFRQTYTDSVVPTPLTEAWLNDFGADVVFEGPQAVTTPPYEFSYYAGVEQIDGKWYTKYAVGPVFTDNEEGTAAEQLTAYTATKDAEQAKLIRQQRDDLLAKTDWSQSKDIADAVSNSWVTYRQALRDVPAQAGFPWNIEWPVKE